MSSAEETPAKKSTKKVKNTKYYDLLNIESDATDEQIRKAYKKMSLKLHPDKALRDGGDPKEVHEKFTAMKAAHEVLSDSKKRQIYDRMGEEGVNMMDSMANMDMNVASAQMATMMASISFKGRLLIVALITVFFGLLILVPVFVAVKTDGDVDWTWLGVLSPLFVVDALFAIFLLVITCSKDNEEQPLSDDELADQKQEKRLTSVRMVVFILQHIFLFLRLDGQSSVAGWNWLVVLAPWMVWEVVDMFDLYRKKQKVMSGTVDEQEAMGMNMDEQKKASYWVLQGALAVCRFAFIVLVALGANQSGGNSPDLNDSDQPWNAVFVPVWVYFGISITSSLVKYVLVKPEEPAAEQAHDDYTRDDSQPDLKETKSEHGIAIFSSLMFLMVFILLSERIQGNVDVDTSIYIILPFLIIMSCLCCILSCCVCCAHSPEDFEQPDDDDSGKSDTDIPSSDNIPPPSYQGADSV